MSVSRKFVRELRRARKEKTPRFRESITFGNPVSTQGTTVLCESKAEHDHLSTWQDALSDGSLKPEEFSIRELFEECYDDGFELAQSLNPRYPGQSTQNLLEAAGGIAASDFSNISGQIVYTRLIEKMRLEEFKFTNMIPTQSTPYDGEKIAGIDGLGDQASVVGELQEYPLIATSEDWIETPQTTKRGFIVPVSKEAVFFDRTGRLLDEAGKVGEWLGVNKEKRAIDCVIDENVTVHRHKWKGTVYGTYVDTPWDNLSGTTALQDYTDIDAVELLLSAITDPSTGEPVVVEANTLICTPQLEMTARRILSATEVQWLVAPVGFDVDSEATTRATRSPNPVTRYNLVTSRQLAARMTTDTTWYLGNPRRAFVYMENWPIAVIRQDEGPAMFHRDIVTQFRCSERGQYYVLEPRVMAKATVA
jgi:hypothetical protein